MIELMRNMVAIIPIDDPNEITANTYISDKELRHAGMTRGDIAISRIIVPHEAKERCDQGIVKYVGPKCKHVKVTDYVIFSGYTGTLSHIEGEGRLIFIPEDFLFCILDEIPATVVNGLYFRDSNGEYFPATYESACNLLASAIHEASWHMYDHAAKQGLNIKTPKLRPEEYDLVRSSDDKD